MRPLAARSASCEFRVVNHRLAASFPSVRVGGAHPHHQGAHQPVAGAHAHLRARGTQNPSPGSSLPFIRPELPVPSATHAARRCDSLPVRRPSHRRAGDALSRMKSQRLPGVGIDNPSESPWFTERDHGARGGGLNSARYRIKRTTSLSSQPRPVSSRAISWPPSASATVRCALLSPLQPFSLTARSVQDFKFSHHACRQILHAHHGRQREAVEEDEGQVRDRG